MTADVFVVGALHLDVIVESPRLPAVDETVVGRSVNCRFGGKGGNQAVAAARLGAMVSMAGQVGRDRFGRQLLDELDSVGVDRSQVRVSNGSSGMSVAIVDSSGDYGAVIVSGVNSEIDARNIAVPKTAKVVLLQNEVPETVNADVALRAKGQATVMLNAAPARPLGPGLLDCVDVLVANLGEAQVIAAARGQEMTERLRMLGPPTVIVTRGAEGLILVRQGRGDVVLPANPVQVVSTHGAGDAFVGALASEIAKGRPLMPALEFAQAAAALFVSRPVADRALIRCASVGDFLNGMD